jgi:hypothetical protein
MHKKDSISRLAYASIAFLYLLHYSLYGGFGILPDTPMYIPSEPGDFSLVSLTGDMPRTWVVTLPFAILTYPVKIVIFHYLVAFFVGVYLVWITLNITKSWPRSNRSIIVGISVLFLISGPPLEWAALIQSDSLAMSLSLGFIFAIAGFMFDKKHMILHFVAMLTFGALASQIRSFMLIFFFPIVLTLLIKAVKEMRSKPTVSLRFLAMISGIFFVIFYTAHTQNKMDLAWGKVLSQHESVYGRSMQQVRVITSNPIGSLAINDIIATRELECIKLELYNPEVTWWGEVAHRCTSEVEEFSKNLQTDYLIYLLKHPRQALQGFSGVYTEAFNFNRGFVPDSIMNFFASRSSKQPTLLLIAFGLTTLLLTGVGRKKAIIMRHSRLPKIELATLLGLTWSGHFAVYLTTLFSPSDTYRVASTSTTSVLFFTVLAITFIVSTSDFRTKPHSK